MNICSFIYATPFGHVLFRSKKCQKTLDSLECMTRKEVYKLLIKSLGLFQDFSP